MLASRRFSVDNQDVDRELSLLLLFLSDPHHLSVDRDLPIFGGLSLSRCGHARSSA